MSLRDELLEAAENLDRETIYIEEWDRDVTLQKLSGIELSFLADYEDREGVVYLAVIAMLHIVDPAITDPEIDAHVFTEADLPRISRWEGAILTRISREATAISRLIEDPEEAAKNSESGRSSSDS